MAARFLRLKLPDNPPWWELFDATKRDIEVICNRLLRLYQGESVAWLESLRPPPEVKKKKACYHRSQSSTARNHNIDKDNFISKPA